MEVGETLRLVPTTEAMRERSRDIERSQQQVASLSEEGRLRLRAVAPERWAWPGLRELVPASIASAVVLLASLGLNVLPARALEHLVGAYGLEYLAQPSASSPRLQLTLARDDADLPRQVDLYRDDGLYRSGLSLGASAPTVVQLEAADTGFHYQVRAKLPEGNLAVSPWVWVASDRLVFVLVDASPWANVTINGGQAATGVQQTPFTAALLPGTYQLHFENPALGSQAVLDQSLTVPAPNAAIHVTMPGFDAAQTVDSFLPGQSQTSAR
jgi:hypothetical protein